MAATQTHTAFYAGDSLETLARSLYLAAGMEADKAHTVARLQVLTDAMGRMTHGLAMAPLYLQEIDKDRMTRQGQPEVVRDNGHTAVWDGGYLPGLWLVDEAIKVAMPVPRKPAWPRSRSAAATTSAAWPPWSSRRPTRAWWP